MRWAIAAMARWMLPSKGLLGPSKQWLAGLFLRHCPGQITCREFDTFLQDYHEGALGKRQRQLFDYHLSICPLCKAQFHHYLQAVELGKRAFQEDEELPPGLEQELINAIIASRRRE